MDSDRLIQFISIMVIVAALAMGGVIVYNIIMISGDSQTAQEQPVETKGPLQNQSQKETRQEVLEEPQKFKQPAPVTVNASKVKAASNPFIGKKEAPITILYWFDYQCPFCKKMEQNIIPQLIEDYIEPGKAKLVYKDYQFLGADSQTAGLAARAVWEIAPERFFEWHKAMYENQDGENYAWGSKNDILILTKSLGIDPVKVGKLMTDKAAIYQASMNADKAEGKVIGIKGTPGTVIGTKLITGAQPYAAFKSLVGEALEAQ